MLLRLQLSFIGLLDFTRSGCSRRWTSDGENSMNHIAQLLHNAAAAKLTFDAIDRRFWRTAQDAKFNSEFLLYDFVLRRTSEYHRIAITNSRSLQFSKTQVSKTISHTISF